MSLFDAIYGNTAQHVLNAVNGTKEEFTYLDAAKAEFPMRTAIRISDKIEVEYNDRGQRNVNVVIFAIPKDETLGGVASVDKKGRLRSRTEDWEIREVLASTGAFTQVECVRHKAAEYTRQRLRE